ncbi:hypothetical protein [Sorangium sp. So ce131]|uniref:hypothetical protein n=1 Tax=Sorangium sp. So ce131 TaxID=3133282 RepID=UPI003F5DB2A0
MQQRSEPSTAVFEEPSPIDDLVDAPPPLAQGAGALGAAVPGAGEVLVGECVDARHPSLAGRVLVRWDGASGPQERWLPTLHGLAVRARDHVLITRPSNWPEPIVTGVVDGFALRPEVPPAEAARIALEPDEVVRITSAAGTPLVEVASSDAGPVVRLLTADVSLELPGDLRLRARSIDLTATQGEVKIKASDDVVVQGETINLN